jgi:RHS repeat-associated protein
MVWSSSAQGNRPSSSPTDGTTTYVYDALGRTTQVTHPDGATVLTTYTGRATQVQDKGNGTQRVTRISQTDGLGRLLSICEVSSTSLLGSGATPVACGQDIAGTGFLTTYQYDTLGNLFQVSQAGISPRAFAHNSFSQLTSATNPESGTTTYTYDNGGNLLTKTDARGIKTTFASDALNRLTGKTYSDSTPAVTFNYDQTSALGVTLTNTIGRKSSESTAGPNATGAVFSYDTMGRLVDNSQCTPLNCGGGVFSLQYPQHDLLGNLLAATNASGVTVNYSYDAAARLTTMTTNFVDGSHPGTLFSNALYGPIGLTSDNLGNGITESLSYSSRGWLKSFTAASGANTRYSFSIGTFAPNGDILAANDSANGNWTYTYDPFNRLLSSNTTGQAYTYDYDRFGNRWHQNGPHSMMLTFTGNNPANPANNNRMDGYSYDAAGNLLNDGTHSYTYDAEGRIATVDGGSTASYVYDAEGRRARKTTASAGSVDYLYDLDAHQVAEVGAGGVFNRGELYADNRHLATYTAGQSGATFFTHSDWLGTERTRTDMTASTCESIASLPFGDGQTITTTCTDVSPMHFTGKQRDPESSLDDFGARYYSSTLGRFASADWSSIPEPVPYANLTNPQTLNLYAIVQDNPETFADLDGHTGNGGPGPQDPGGCDNRGPASGCTKQEIITAGQTSADQANENKEGRAAQQLADLYKSNHPGEQNPQLASVLVVLDAAEKAINNGKNAVTVGASADVGPLGIDSKGNVSLNGPAGLKELGASVDIKIGAPSEQNTAGEVTLPGKHFGVGTNITNDGALAGVNIKIGIGAPTGPGVSTQITTLQKIGNFVQSAVQAYGKLLAQCGAGCAVIAHP